MFSEATKAKAREEYLIAYNIRENAAREDYSEAGEKVREAYARWLAVDPQAAKARTREEMGGGRTYGRRLL